MRGDWKVDEMGVVVFVPSGETPKPQVGIFWLVDDEVVKDAVFWEDVPARGGMIRHGNHESILQGVISANDTIRKIKSAPGNFYPKGWAIFIPEREVFRLFFDRRLESDEEMKVIEAFDIEDYDIEIVVCGPDGPEG